MPLAASLLAHWALNCRTVDRETEIFAARVRKLEAARQQRQLKRQAARMASVPAEEKSSLTDPAALVRVAVSRQTEAGSAEEQPAEG